MYVYCVEFGIFGFFFRIYRVFVVFVVFVQVLLHKHRITHTEIQMQTYI